MTYIGNKVLALSPGSTALPARKGFCNGQLWPGIVSMTTNPFLTAKSKICRCQFYPADMTAAEFDAWQFGKKFKYTMVRRNSSGKLEAIPYHKFFCEKLERASFLLEQAVSLADDAGLRKLTTQAKALISDDYQASDMAWLDMKNQQDRHCHRSH